MNIGYSKSFIQKVGHKIHNGELLNDDEELAFASFRKAHAKILKNFRDRLSSKVSKNVAVGGRLKTRNTIIAKLQKRFISMDLTRMQDIAGVRLVFENYNALNNFRQSFLLEDDTINYERINKIDKYDYIQTPNMNTGYRCIHDIYREKSNDPIKTHIEIQYRTAVQQAWASTLEIWDKAFDDETKFGLSGKKDIQELLKYISELFARELEGMSFMKEISDEELFKQIIKLDKSTRFIANLETIKPVRQTNIEQMTFDYVVIDNPSDSDVLKVNTLNTKDADRVFDLYKRIEDKSKEVRSNTTTTDIVMIGVKKPDKNFRKLYNNYINDFVKFRNFYEQAVQSLKKRLGFKAVVYATVLNPKYLYKRDS